MRVVALSRLLKYINVLIGLMLAGAAAGAFWFGYRLLPKTSGEVQAPISAAGKIIRDSLGVPHIEAATIEDALFLQGYAMAQDRLFQIDGLRRLAAGELSEVIGRRTLESDQTMRRLRLRRIAEEHARRLPPLDRQYLAAFGRGINYFIETHRDALPVEFAILGYDPKPWTLVDQTLVGLQMFRELTTSWEDELEKRRMLATGEPAFVEALYPHGMTDRFLPGSNAWAISGKLTASGKPILANDPHLQWGLPSRWYMVHLKTPQLHVAGATIPGAPGVIVGHNERIAWGVTNLHFDVQDLYIEQFDPRTGQYVFNGKIEQAQGERELIAIRGEKPVEFVNWVTRHGPFWTQDGQQYLFLKWVAAQPGSFGVPFIELGQARDWRGFREALRRFPGPGQNFVYADADGNIGYQATGRLPIRRTYEGDVPAAGDGSAEWDGYVPFDELPSTYNPASGIVATANQNPFGATFPYRVNGAFAPPYRVRQIRDMLRARTGWKAEDMVVVQKDVYSSLLHLIAKETVKAYDTRGRRNTAVNEAVEVLRQWNGQMEKDQAAPLLATLIYYELRRSVADRASGGKGATYQGIGAGPVIERLLHERPKGWFADYDQWLLRALLEAFESGKKMQGSSAPRWKYGQTLEITIRHPVLGAIPYIGDFFNVGPVTLSGAATTVKQTSLRNGPSMRFVADLSDWDRSLMNLTLGQSGQPFSPHYKDQWDSYYAGKSFPLRFQKVTGDVLRFVPAK